MQPIAGEKWQAELLMRRCAFKVAPKCAALNVRRTG
jgi:hypothetical protein